MSFLHTDIKSTPIRRKIEVHVGFWRKAGAKGVRFVAFFVLLNRLNKII